MVEGGSRETLSVLNSSMKIVHLQQVDGDTHKCHNRLFHAQLTLVLMLSRYSIRLAPGCDYELFTPVDP